MGALKKIKYNCKKATFLMEKRMLASISFREHVELHIHLVGCSVCRLFDKQSHIISEMVRQLLHIPNKHDIRLDDNFKDKLQERIETELNKN